MLRWVYEMISSIGAEPEIISYYAISIIITTIILKFIIIPISMIQTKNQLKIAELQPEIEKLQKKYKNDQQTLMVKQQKLYKDANYNPLSGCLPLLIQFPIVLAFYRIFQFPQKFAFTDPGMYEAMQKNFFHIADLDLPETTLILPIIAAALTYLSTVIAQKNASQKAMSNPETEKSMRMMNLMMPVMIFFFARKMAAGLVIYWIASSLFQIVQQLISNHVINQRAEEEMN